MNEETGRKVEETIGSVEHVLGGNMALRLFGTFIILVLILVSTQVWIHMNTERGIEQTLGGIYRDESCKVLETTHMEERQQVRTITKISCTTSGEHLLYGAEFPDYFKKGDKYGTMAITREEYESQKRPW